MRQLKYGKLSVNYHQIPPYPCLYNSYICLQLDVSDTIVDEVYKRLDSMYSQFKMKHKKKTTDKTQQNGFYVSSL